MTIAELIERLEEYREQLGDNAEVRLMMQPAWPFEYSIARQLVSTSEIEGEEDEDGEKEDGEKSPAMEDVVYLLEGSQLGYGNKNAWR